MKKFLICTIIALLPFSALADDIGIRSFLTLDYNDIDKEIEPAVRFSIEGDLDSQIAVKAQLEFSGDETKIGDIYVDYMYYPGLGVRIGQFRGLAGLEKGTSSAKLIFHDRSLMSSLTPSRDKGIMAYFASELATVELSTTSDKEHGIRLYSENRGIHAGIFYTDRIDYSVYGVEMKTGYGPIEIQGEYAWTDDDRNSAYFQVGLSLTDELQIAGRYQFLDEERNITTGINYDLNEWVSFYVGYMTDEKLENDSIHLGLLVKI